MEDILLVHRKSSTKVLTADCQSVASFAGASAYSREPALWKTCLRQIMFLDSSSFSFTAQADDQIFRGQDALAFLMEILCGLHSPVLGETEVWGQFKLFVQERRAKNDPLFVENKKWLQFVLTEVKKIRAEHMKNLGSNSYGSLLRKYTRDSDSVSLFGAGHLVGEILPWVALKKEIHVVSRQPERLNALTDKWPHLQLETYQDLSSLNEVLVIAAPLEDERILTLLKDHGSKVRHVFDLRGEVNQLPDLLAHTGLKIHTLQQLFDEMSESRKENLEKILVLKALIADKTLQFHERTELRPLGWDDLCA